ncbi:MAG: hypothetical protein AMXMBFR53_41630 [Gemmatimonadota bacterium]
MGRTWRGAWGVALSLGALGACGGAEEREAPPPEAAAGALSWDMVQDTTRRVASVGGFASPEAVRYDPDQDVWFVSNFNGDGDVRDGNGFVSRVSGDGEVLSLHFAQGTGEHPLHAPRGMFITGDTLWVADIDGVHAFDRHSGSPVAFVDFGAHEPGFLNDIAAGPDGVLHVTDTGKSTVYRVEGREVTVAVADTLLGNPNGITWSAEGGVFVTVPWDPGRGIRAWRPGEAPSRRGPAATPGRLDGVEIVAGRLLVASQTDSSLVVVEGDVLRPVVKLPGRPADIGVDTRRRLVAVPYLALDRVDVWELPPGS